MTRDAFMALASIYGEAPEEQKLLSVTGREVSVLTFQAELAPHEYESMIAPDVQKDKAFNFSLFPESDEVEDFVPDYSEDGKLFFYCIFIDTGFKEVEVSLWDGLVPLTQVSCCRSDGKMTFSLIAPIIGEVAITCFGVDRIMGAVEDLEICIVFNAKEIEQIANN